MPRFTAYAALLCACAAHAGEPPPATADGGHLFRRYCVSCHGPSGRGDGPVAPALRTPVPDLTRIGTRNGGGFPADRVRDMIDGRAAPAAHGPREMPVWGYELEARAPEAAPGRATAAEETDRLVEYLRSIQQPEGE